MALTFVHCQSCGGRTQINPRMPAEEQLCMLCGKPSGGREEEFDIPSAGKAAEKPAAHVPVMREAGTCPHCFADVVIDTARDLKQQRCHACGHRLVKRRKIDKERKADAPEAETELFRRAKERVWLPYAGVTLAVVLTATWILWMVLRPETKKAVPVNVTAPSDDAELTGKLVARFAAAQSAEEVLPLVREPAKNEASVRRWFAAHPGAPVPGGVFIGIVATRTVFDTNLCQVAISGQAEPLLLAKTKDGWRVEWRALVAEGEMTLEEVLEKHPAEPVLVLVVVQRSTYYNEPYASANVWQSLYLSGKKGSDGCHAYAPRNNPALMAKLAALPESLRDGRNMPQTSLRMAFRLHFTSPEAIKLGMAEIVSVEGDGWFIP